MLIKGNYLKLQFSVLKNLNTWSFYLGLQQIILTSTLNL